MDQTWSIPRATRHVWVWQDDTHRDAPLQGFVVEWRRHSYRSWANVLTVSQDAEGRPLARLGWVEMNHMTPVRSEPNGGRIRYLS